MANFTLTGGITQSYISNDAYLIIIYGKDRDAIPIATFNKNTANKSQNFLDKTISTGAIGNLVMAGITSPIAQNLASKALSSATLGRINSSLYDIMSDGKISVREVAEDFIGSCTNTLDNIATNLGFPTPSALYDAIMPNGTGVISKDFMNLFSKQSKKQNDDIENRIKEEKLDLNIIKLKLVNSDEENLEIDIPTRKTENNFNIATSINNHNRERSFEATIVHDDNKKINMYQVKNQLKQLRELREHVDVYINDSDIQESEIIKDCLLSNLSFNTENKNSIVCSISFTEVPKWEVVIDASLDKSLSNKSINGKGKTVKDKKTPKTNIKNNDTKFTNLKNFQIGENDARNNINARINSFNQDKGIKERDITENNPNIQHITDVLNQVKKYKGISPKEVLKIINAGGRAVEK